MATIRHSSLISDHSSAYETRRFKFSWTAAALVLSVALVAILGLLFRLTFLHRSAAAAIAVPSAENRFNAESYRGPASFLIGNEILDAAREAGSRFEADQARLRSTDEFAQGLISSNIELVSFSPIALQRLRSTLESSQIRSKNVVEGAIDKRLQLLPELRVLPEGVMLKQLRLSTGVVSTLQFDAVDRTGNRVEGLGVADLVVTNTQGDEYPFFTIDQVTSPLADYSIAVLVDTSTSMSGERLTKLQSALNVFIANCSSTTRIQIVGFDSKVTPLTLFTNDHRVLADAVKSIRADGTTEISMAVDYVLGSLGDKSGTRSILLCTDGQDPNLANNIQRIVTSCLRSRISINVLGLADSSLDRANLSLLAKQTSGQFCVADSPLAIADQMNRILSSYSKVAYRLFVFNPNRKLDRYRMKLIGNPSTFIEVQP